MAARLVLETKKSRPWCKNKCPDATVVQLYVIPKPEDAPRPKRVLLRQWHKCGCSAARQIPTTAQEALKFCLGLQRKSPKKMARLKSLGLIDGSATVEHSFRPARSGNAIRRFNRLWLTSVFVKPFVMALWRKITHFVCRMPAGLVWQELGDAKELKRLAYIGDALLASAIKIVIAERKLYDHGLCRKFYSAHHLARVGLRLGLEEKLGISSQTADRIKESLAQFNNPLMHKGSLRRISEMVEALIGHIYERYGYEVALAFVRDKIVLPYLNAPFCGKPHRRKNKAVKVPDETKTAEVAVPAKVVAEEAATAVIAATA